MILSIFDLFHNPATAVFLIPIAAIAVGGIIAIVKLQMTHRERMAMIERGMHPDAPRPGEDPDEPRRR
ncbi:MAG: hypothetical protein JXP34_00620 [Planctomycetes bacterium]|nr:hypothetical protein [Planctomycetota bacterium]